MVKNYDLAVWFKQNHHLNYSPAHGTTFTQNG